MIFSEYFGPSFTLLNRFCYISQLAVVVLIFWDFENDSPLNLQQHAFFKSRNLNSFPLKLMMTSTAMMKMILIHFARTPLCKEQNTRHDGPEPASGVCLLSRLLLPGTSPDLFNHLCLLALRLQPVSRCPSPAPSYL